MNEALRDALFYVMLGALPAFICGTFFGLKVRACAQSLTSTRVAATPTAKNPPRRVKTA